MSGRLHSVDVIALVVLSVICRFITSLLLFIYLRTTFECSYIPGSVLEALGSLKGFFTFTKRRHGFNELLTGHLHDCSKGPGAETKTNSSHVHAESDWSCSEEFADSGVTNHQELHVKLAEEDDPEPEVLEWLLEDVEVG